MRKKKMRAGRIISMLLAVTMILTSLPQSMMSVSAAEIVSGNTVSSDAEKEEEKVVTTQDGETSEVENPESEVSEDSNPEESNTDEAASDDAGLDDETQESDKPDEGISQNEESDENASDDKSGEETSQNGESDEEGSEENKESGENAEQESEDVVSDYEEDAGEVSADIEAGDAAEPDMLEEGEDVYLLFNSKDDNVNFDILDSENNSIIEGTTIVNPEEFRFKVVPHEGYVITGVTVDNPKNTGARVARTEAGAGYDCRLFPGYRGYLANEVSVTITVKAKNNYNLTFVYADGDVEALVVTNGETKDQPVNNNEAIQTTNESGTSFKLKMKGNKAPIVIQEPVGNADPEDRINLTPDVDGEGRYKKDGDYYCYSPGKILEDTVITIEEGWRVSFEYDKAEISDLYRVILEDGDEDDIGMEDSEVWFGYDVSIADEIFVAKGETLYFSFERDSERLGNVSVLDDGNPCRKIKLPDDDTTYYKVVPQGDMRVTIEIKPYEIPVKYVDGNVKNISISSPEDEQIAYNAEGKKITNIYKEVPVCNISFELEDSKTLNRVEAVYHYDYGDGEDYFEYKEIEVTSNSEGVYTGSFGIEGGLSEIRIVAGESYTINFEISAGINVYDRNGDQIEIDPDATDPYTITVTEGDNYILRISMKEGYYLATPSVVATIGEETKELEVERIEYDYETQYRVDITPTADMSIKIFAVPESIPFKYTEGAIKDIEVKNAALSEDKKYINIYNDYELMDCEITFKLEDGKTVTRAYCEYVIPVYDEDWWEVIGTTTYTESIPLSYNDDTKSYKLEQRSIVGDIIDSIGWVDSIYVVAGDESKLTFDVPEGKASVYSFNNYKYDYTDGALTNPVKAVLNEEYLFGVILSKDYDASSITVTAGSAQEELKVKSYVKYNFSWGEEYEDTIAYYSYTPAKTAETIHVRVNPQSIPVKYEDGAVKSLSMAGYETDTAGKPELESNNVLLWNYNTPLKFALELESGKKLSGIFSRYAGVNPDSSIEKEIDCYESDGRYEFEINNNSGDLGDLLEIEIVTDKINLSTSTATLKLGNVELSKDSETGEYYTSYKAQAIEPEVTITYNEDGTDKTLDKDEYVVSYKDNRKVGTASVIIKPKEGSNCAGSKEIKFRIDKAAAPAIAKCSIYTETGDAVNAEKNNRTLNLSKRFVVSTALNEDGVEPISYSYVSHTPGGVLDSSVTPSVKPFYAEIMNPWGEVIDEELLYYELSYSVADSATKDSQPGTIVLEAKFDNYESAQVTIEVSVKEKTTLKLGAEIPSNKKYDAEAFSYGVENVYVVDDTGKKLENSDDIMDEIKDSIRFHYTGETRIGKFGVKYDSYEAPVKPGDYRLTVEISETDDTYKAEPCNAGGFMITRRNIMIKAEPVEINVGDPIPEEYPYTIDDTDLLPGDTIVSKPVLSCSVRNTETEGRYEIRVNYDDIDICNSDGDSVYGYYSVESKNAWLTVSKVEVVKTQITLSKIADDAKFAKTYDNTEFNADSLIEAKNGTTAVTDAIIDIKYTGYGDTVYALQSKAPVNAGTYTVKAKVSASDNKYKSDEISFNIVINKAAAPTLQEQIINLQPVTVDTPETLDITQYIPDEYEVMGYEAVGKTDPDNVLTGTEQVSAQGVLSYTLKAGDATGTAVLTIPVKFKNHGDATLTVKINLTTKTLLTLTQAVGVEVDREYNGNEYELPAEAVNISGFEPGKNPKLLFVYTLRGSSEPVTAVHAGQYTVKVTVAESDENYVANTPLLIDFEITKKTVNVRANSGKWNKTFDERPTAVKYPLGYEAEGFIGSDNLINEPASYSYTYTAGGEETVLADTDEAWKALEADTVITVIPAGAMAADDYEIAYISGKLTVTGLPKDDQLYVPDIAPMTYTGSQLKPQVKVYIIKNGEPIELTAKDYKVTYGTNKDAGKGTVTITGKGNYENVITKEFTIDKASIGNGSENNALGITLKYTDQSLNTKASKLVTSLKYKKALKEGTDFTVTLKKEGVAAPASETGAKPAMTPTGDDKVGTYTLRIEAKDNTNYSGYIEKKVYIAGKDNLLKNAKITLKKKSFKWDDKDTANYGNYSKDKWGGFYLIAGSSKDDAKDFTVSMGKTYLTNKQTSAGVQDEESQYFISYTNNDQAGTATITVTGDGKTYFGTKSATFKIQGTPFKAGTKDGNIKLPEILTDPENYTGKEITKDLGSLEIVGKTDGTKLTRDADYTVTFSNNVKKGNAVVIITADPKSGYTGSIKKNFKIMPADLTNAIKSASGGNVELKHGTGGTEGSITGIEYKDPVSYSKSGAEISGLVFKNAQGNELKAGTDYTVKYTYSDKKDKKAGSSATMTLNGKGNYTGKLDVTFTIGKAAYSELEVSVAPVKTGNKAAKPKVTVKDGKKALTVSEDGSKEVKVTYANNEPDKVQEWLKWMSSGTSAGSSTAPVAPTVTIEIVNNANYEQALPDTRTLNVYSDKLDKNKLTINWRDTAKTTDFTYNGEQVKPVIDSITYDGKNYTVKTVGKDYYACDGNNIEIFKITYGANNKSGKNAGSVTIEGLKLYGGKYTEKFEIKCKDISKK